MSFSCLLNNWIQGFLTFRNISFFCDIYLCEFFILIHINLVNFQAFCRNQQWVESGGVGWCGVVSQGAKPQPACLVDDLYGWWFKSWLLPLQPSYLPLLMGEQQRMVQGLVPLCPCERSGGSSRFPGLSWTSHSWLWWWPLGSVPKDARKIVLPPLCSSVLQSQ